MLASSSKIQELARRLVATPDLTLLPEYLLSRLDRASRPFVLLFSDEKTLDAVFFAEQRHLCGLPTGWCSGGDEMGRGLVLAAPDREREVLKRSCDVALHAGMHALRLRWNPTLPADSPGLMEDVRTPLVEVRQHTVTHRHGDWLSLPSAYEVFLDGLGSHTRRNMRYYRRKAEEQGVRCVRLNVKQYRDQLARLRRLADYPHTRERQQRDDRFLHIASDSLALGLVDPNGQFLSLLLAVPHGPNLHVLSQLNDESHRRMSVSLVLRSYLIEQAIDTGFGAIHFVNGSSPMMGRYCPSLVVHSFDVDRRSRVFHPIKSLGALYARSLHGQGKRVPMRLRTALGSYYRHEEPSMELSEMEPS